MVSCLFKKTLLFTGLLMTCLDPVAGATATATVTVNIVPESSFSVPDSIKLNIKPVAQTVKRSVSETDRVMVMRTLNAHKPARVKVVPYDDRIYEITVSSRLTAVNASGSIEIRNMKVASETELTGSNDEKAVVIEGEIARPGSKRKGSFTGTTEITMNYN